MIMEKNGTKSTYKELKPKREYDAVCKGYGTKSTYKELKLRFC